ncbi:4'-phosphopantetheinyl transferase [Kribbella amoyensis]|uniref:4'-phosphopantetheinyl transferase n=1 Tax=Kribbella amoyensis TaxID=996641 RepID=A0A561BVD0_9ACTN|nr:4'-phosphopantetheinyl transferase superfamily protein [Kribbella amoyensis]TWD82807.1 4'-phosphopantetheinyl transferase [Kribbella amoyensis]
MSAVEVWWARLDDSRPALADDLDAVERERLNAYARDEDKARFLLGVAIVRRVLGVHLLLPPAAVQLDRTCPDCGRPHGKVHADGMQVSVSHSGDLIGVAFHPSTPVGLDVELVDPKLDPDALATITLADSEAAHLTRYAETDRARAFTQYWTRKEALVKATGDGIRADFRKIVVTPPDQPAAVLDWPAHTGPVQLADLAVDAKHVASLAALTSAALTVHSIDAAPLLTR